MRKCYTPDRINYHHLEENLNRKHADEVWVIDCMHGVNREFIRGVYDYKKIR